MDMESMYQEVILDHYRSPHGRGLRDPYDAEVMHVNPTCGDEITLRVRLSDDDDPIVEDVSYWSQGCSISQASASVLFDEVENERVSKAFTTLDALVALMHAKGQTEPDEEVLGDLVAFEGVAKFPARVKCALLAWMALKDAVGQAREGLPMPVDDTAGVSLADPPRHELHIDTGLPERPAPAEPVRVLQDESLKNGETSESAADSDTEATDSGDGVDSELPAQLKNTSP
jgi:nitrogen fixation NifU-like protein